MRLKLKYVLPLAQMLTAVALLAWTAHWQRALMRIQDMPGAPPSFALLIFINAPLALPRALAFRFLPGWWDDITLVVAIGAFWYWVSLNIESWQQGRRVLMFSWTPLRLVGDTIAVCIGMMLAFVVWDDRAYRLPPLFSFTDWLRFVSSVCAILWSAVLILLFGRDFIHCLLQSNARSDSL